MGRWKRSREQIDKDILLKSKVCCICEIRKSFDEFYNMNNKGDKKSYRCKICDDLASKKWKNNNTERAKESSRRRTIKFKYNIELSVYDDMLKRQSGCCAICETSKSTSTYGKNISPHFAIDHDHATGRIRGLLCNNCNRALGLFGDSVVVLKNATKYLSKHETH
jgi:hypothetical protein